MLKLLIFVSAFSLICGDISPCAKWSQTGQTVAGTGTAGSSSSQIDSAKGIFIHKQRNELYIADFANNRVQLFNLNQTSPDGVTVISNIENPMKLFVDDDPTGPTIYVSLRFLNRTEKWKYQSTQGEQVGGECRLCCGVFVDQNKNVYMAESDRHRVIQYSPQTNQTTIFAGKTDTKGNSSDLLDHPQGIYLNRTGNILYIADMWNNRIQQWNRDSSQGKTIAGSNSSSPGDDPTQFDHPNDLIVDDLTNVVYVIDSFNNRLQRWKPSSPAGETIVGGAGSGSRNDQLNKPVDLAFDLQGNLYVLDMNNNRVQMFQLIDNRPCLLESKSSTILPSISMLIVIFFHQIFI